MGKQAKAAVLTKYRSGYIPCNKSRHRDAECLFWVSYRLSNPAQLEKRKKGKSHGKKRIRPDAAAGVR